jgi:hypothetical protein
VPLTEKGIKEKGAEEKRKKKSILSPKIHRIYPEQGAPTNLLVGSFPHPQRE